MLADVIGVCVECIYCVCISESAKDFDYDGLFIRWFVDLPTGNVSVMF